MQTNLKPKAATVWSQPNCPACTSAKALLNREGIAYRELMIGVNGVSREDFFQAVPGARSVPQIFLDDTYVGGYDKLAEVLRGDNS